MFRTFAAIVLIFVAPHVAGQTQCTGGSTTKTDVEKLLKYINDRRIKLVNGTETNGSQNTTLPPAKNMAQIAWNCDLESRAKAAIGTTCTDTEPAKPTGNTAFFAAYGDPTYYSAEYFVNQWMAEIDIFSIADTSISQTEVKYDNTALVHYANLVRSTTTGIGCYELKCAAEIKYNFYCLTDQPELKTGEVIYQVGTAGGCTSDSECNGGTCDKATGLCIPPSTTSTTSTTTTTTTTTTPSPAVFPSPGGTSQNQRCPSSMVMTDTLRFKFLDMHNNRRQLLATGQVAKRNGNKLPTAANMQRMRYNCAMEMQIGEFLRTCPMAASAESARAGLGENFIRIPESGIADYTAAIQKAVTSWWKVIRTTEGIGMAVTFRAHHVGAPIASFTQMAWANTRKLGCGIVKCPGTYIAVCRYSPMGNFVEQVVYAKGAPCTACPSGAWCTNNALCTLP